MELEIAILSFVFTAFLATLSATLPPGPIFAMAVTEATRRGCVGGFMIVAGDALVGAMVLIALTLGLGAFLTSDTAEISVNVLAGFLLIWTGQVLVRDAHKGAMSVETVRVRAPSVRFRSPKATGLEQELTEISRRATDISKQLAEIEKAVRVARR